MRVLDLQCTQCAAPLEVPAKVRFLTCQFCNTKLQVEQSGGAAYTSLLEEIADDVRDLKRASEVERLDREWALQREEHVVHRREGQSNVPTRGGAIAIAIFAVAGGTIWMSFAAKMGAPGPFLLFGVLFIAVGLFGAISGARKAHAYDRDRETWQRKRRALMDDEP